MRLKVTELKSTRAYELWKPIVKFGEAEAKDLSFSAREGIRFTHKTYCFHRKFKLVAWLQMWMVRLSVRSLARAVKAEGYKPGEGQHIVYIRSWYIKRHPERAYWKGYLRCSYGVVPPRYERHQAQTGAVK